MEPPGLAQTDDAESEREGPLISAAEVAELFGVHPSTIRRLARQGRIPAYWVGSAPRFDTKEVATAFRRKDDPPQLRRYVPRPDLPDDRPRGPVGRDRLRTELFG